MSIKKQYIGLVSFLEANSDKKVSEILAQVKEMTVSKTNTQTHVKDADGNTIAIYCYFHKQWEFLSEVEYGRKASSSTGWNTMCKKGVNAWTKMQKAIKDIKVELLDEVSSGKLEVSEIASRSELLEAKIRTSAFEDNALPDHLYHTPEEVMEYKREIDESK